MTKQTSELRLPDYFTLLGMGAALAAVFLAVKGEFWAAYLMLLIQFTFDTVDGRIARKYGAGRLGVYLDSFSDFTSITAAIVFGWQIGIDTSWIYLAGFFFLFAAAIRLSYFTVRAQEGKTDFIGIPTVLATIIIGTLIIANYHIELVTMNWLVILYFIFGYMMITDFRFKKI